MCSLTRLNRGAQDLLIVHMWWVLQFWNSLVVNTSIKVGNGRNTLFWSDNWLGHDPLKEMFSEFYGIATIPEIKVEEARGQHGWNITFRRGFSDWEMSRNADFSKALEAF